VLETFGSVQMKFRNICFGFLKTWLLIAIFYRGSLYAAGYVFLTLYDYQPITNNFRPYFFEKDPYTGKLTKVFDSENCPLPPIPNHLKQVEHALYIMPYRLLIPQCKFQIENHSLSQIL
jgi:hypothetical protein